MTASSLVLSVTLTLIGRRFAWVVVALTVNLLGTGCAALSNPVGDGIPVHRLPPEFLASPVEETKLIPLTSLRQPAPDAHHVDAGDVLGIFIEGVTGEKTMVPPVQFPNQTNLKPSTGYPVVINDDGLLPLPFMRPLDVKGMTIPQVRERIIKAYTEDYKILTPGKEKGSTSSQVLVSLMRARHVRVQVVRQDSGSAAGPVATGGVGVFGGGTIGNTRRGTGTIVDLPAYENDVLNALNHTGGLPGLDAINEIIIERGVAGKEPSEKTEFQVLRIPMRLRAGEPLPFKPADVILKTGDIVFVEARDTAVYYTGGLMYPRQFPLPRDYDLRVVNVVANAGGPLVNGGITQNNFTGQVIGSGIGSPSPSRVTIVRRTKGNGQISIRVDLNKALNDPRENIIIQAGDVIILQETVGEATTRYVTSVLRFNLFGIFSKQGDFLGTANANLP